MLTHAEYQSILRKKQTLLEEYLQDLSPASKAQYEAHLADLNDLLEKGTSCLDCTLDKNSQH